MLPGVSSLPDYLMYILCESSPLAVRSPCSVLFPGVLIPSLFCSCLALHIFCMLLRLQQIKLNFKFKSCLQSPAAIQLVNDNLLMCIFQSLMCI